MATKTKDLVIEQGKTFKHVLRYGEQEYVYSPIASISASAPAVIVTTAAHGVPDGWPVTVVSALGSTQINAANSPPKEADYRKATVLTSTSLELNEVNSSAYTAHTPGTGYVQYRKPVDLAGYVGRMKIKDKVGGVLLASTEAGDALLNTLVVSVDNANKAITILMSSANTAELEWTKGVYELELVGAAPDYVTDAPLAGKITVSKEIAT